MSPTNTCIIYCRVSSKEQIEGTSLETQERACREYASKRGWGILHVFTELGESAKTADRTEFNKAILYCTGKKNAVGYFIVHKLDRFARNQLDHVVVRQRLHEAGTELKSVLEQFDETPIGKMMEGITSVFAEFDNNVRMERTRNGMVQRVREGIWVWPPPIGYFKPHLGKGTNIVPDPETAPLIKFAFEEYSHGIFTYKALAELLAKRGLKTKNGNPPSLQLMEKVIHNPVYCGRIESFDEVVRGKFEPLISEKLFDDCQHVVDGRAVPIVPRSANNPDFPLRTFVRCKECGEPLTGSHSTGRRGGKYPYYHHRGSTKCGCSRSIPKRVFEQSFVEYLDSIAPKKEYLDLFKAVVMDIWKSNYKHFDEANAKIEAEVRKLEEERQRIFDHHRTKRYSDGEFEEQKKIINARIDEKRTLLEVGWNEELDMEKALEHCHRFVTHTSESWLNAEYELKLEYQGSTFPKGVNFDGKNYGTPEISLIYELQKTPCEEPSALVARRGIGPLLPG